MTGRERSAFHGYGGWESEGNSAVDSLKAVRKQTGLEIIQKFFVTKPGCRLEFTGSGKDGVSCCGSGAIGGGDSIDFAHFLKKWARAC